ncbi:MAG: CDP-diacylglycerol--glycerol-3-phosphate 3-phosphatidyltransferase [Candidatus Methylomirabilia bacterium]
MAIGLGGLMGLANSLTLLRILLIPVFVSLLVYRWTVASLLIFCVASLTDLLDGYIARRRGSQSRLGAFLDPMADKLLLTTAFITLTYLYPTALPFWITVVVISRDLLLVLGAVLVHMAGGQIHPTPTALGKACTGLQMVTILAVLLGLAFPMVPGVKSGLVWVTAMFTVSSGIQYLYRGAKLLNQPSEKAPQVPTLIR